MFNKVGEPTKRQPTLHQPLKVIPWPIAKHKENPQEEYEAFCTFSIISEFLHPIKKPVTFKKRGGEILHSHNPEGCVIKDLITQQKFITVLCGAEHSSRWD